MNIASLIFEQKMLLDVPELQNVHSFCNKVACMLRRFVQFAVGAKI